MPGADAAIVLALGPACGPSLPGCTPAGRPAPVTLGWHDTPDGALAADGLALQSSPEGWDLRRLRSPGLLLPCAVLHAAGRRELLGPAVPVAAGPVATLQGSCRRFLWHGTEGDVAVTLLEGVVGGAAMGRLTARGPPSALAAVAASMASAGVAEVPGASLAAEAMAHAGVRPLPLVSQVAPQLRPVQDVGDAAAAILDHLVGTVLHWSARIAGPGDPEPVHQMRVATRRLRSALSTVRHALPALAPLAAPLRECAARLGQARDWDVFLSGAGRTLLELFPGDRRCTALTRAAERARGQAYAELHGYLAGPEFRAATVALAVAAALQPWRDPALAAASQPLEPFAAAILARRHRALRRAGRGIDNLPAPALHELRKACKRLRYGLDLLSPLYPARPARRLLRRLSLLQEELGTLNDAAEIPALLRRLGRLERGYAAGVLVGMAEMRAAAARERVGAAWSRVRAADPFWAV